MTARPSVAERDADELSLLMQHYETSFAITQGRERVRDRMLWVLVSLSLALTLIVFGNAFAVSQPPSGGWLWVAYSLQGPGLQFVIWMLILVATLRHMQVASRIEADYSYLHKLETYLNERMTWTFCRERVGYVPEFPLPDTRKGVFRLVQANRACVRRGADERRCHLGLDGGTTRLDSRVLCASDFARRGWGMGYFQLLALEAV